MSIQEDRGHTLGDILDSAVRQHNSDFDRDNTQQTHIPEAVRRFCDALDKNFAGTAARLNATAQAMYDAADTLRERAGRISSISSSISNDVRSWVDYERESNEMEKYFAPLFKK